MPKEKGKHAGGRPSKLETLDLEQIKKLASFGLTDVQLSDFFQITEQTLANWKNKSPQFFESLKAGKEISDHRVVESLYKRACGYDAPDRTIGSLQTFKHIPPDPTSMIFWLKNRQPEQWRDVHAIESRFVFEFVGRLSNSLNALLPEKCPHCKKPLSLREETIKTLEQISRTLEASKAA